MARNRYFEDEVLVEKFNSKMFKRMLKYAKPYRSRFIFAFCMMIIMGFVVLIPPYLNKFILDSLLIENSPYSRPVLIAIGILGAWLSVGIADVLYNYARQRILSKTAFSMVRDLRQGIFYHLQSLSFDYFDNRPSGKVLVRVTSYVDELSNLFSTTLIGLMVDVIKMALVLSWLYILDYKLAGFITLVTIPMGITLILLHKVLRKKHVYAQNKSSNRTAYIAENIQGTGVTKAFNRTDINCDIEKELTENVTNAWSSVVKTSEFIWPTMDFFWNLGTMGIYTLAFILGTYFLDSSMSVGLVVSFVGYLAMFQSPLFNLGQFLQQIAAGSSRLERIFETLDTPPSVVDAPDAYPLPEIKGNVKYEGVDFCYEQGINILENLSFEIEAGKSIALVGATGGGKTTVVNLLSRFYNLTNGTISIDGHDISKVTLESLRTQVGVMMQDSFIFSGTIMDNIRYARPDATDSECIDAAKKARCDEFIRTMDGGYNHRLQERGAELSAGQIQLLSFARTILCDPKILILDEATSNIDTATEKDIQEILEELLKGRTSFIIAHRLSTIKKADCIFYIANKGIAEAGTHEQLMAKKGLYYALAKTR